ncbi:MAG: hypothetical protein WCK43_08340, partial [bacterium]
MKIFASLKTLTLSFLVTFGLIQQSLAGNHPSQNENCRILLSSLRTVTNEVLPSEEMSRYISLHRWARNWRGDPIPREVQIGKNLITELEDAMVNDKLTVAVNIARTMIDGAAISFRQHEQVTAAMKEVSNLRAQIEIQGETLEPAFLLNLQEKFL